ncbi:ATPase, AAA-type, core [Metarhizium album ARSEF 1941]|uniref:ATPase, AAA-type, core n=1 Tax=Metarhizium album (strain ARSEF 1941) TaxID=1081103 RepID=A0A0B2WUS4_METAS|nr:ATPase, AAA-type, core [Metarhizium album ARSEF 1941]KHN97823.1 ATPase, AAA-type, core [Metarhizium album ARSEF 1941]
MQTPILKALPATIVATAKGSWALPVRAIHSTPSRRHGAGSVPGGKPSDDFVTEHDNEPELQPATGTTGGRPRNHTGSALKSRLARRRAASALPPVTLPSEFLHNNVSLYAVERLPRLPAALVEDATRDKLSRLFQGHTSLSRQNHRDMQSYFETALTSLLLRDCELAMDFERSKAHDNDHRWNKPASIQSVIRVWDMILDSAWHVVDCIYPARQPDYTYKVRPFWWWDIYKDLDRRTSNFRDQLLALTVALDEQLSHAEQLAYPLSHAVVDLPVDTLMSIQNAVNRDLQAPPPAVFDPKSSKRPITILSTSGYGGKSISQAVGEHLAFWNHADLIHLDAQDLSVLVGDYLGLNWAYSRGAVSMMGFRASEINGKLVKEPSGASVLNEEEDHDTEAGIIGLRASTGSLDDELQKIRQGEYDCFSKWENLKIDKILDHIIRAPELKAVSPQTSQRPLLIHLHDIVELSMTLEGSLLLGRLRALVDTAWHQGTKIAIVGTSSSEKPSEEYQNAVSQFAATDWVITRHLEPDRVDRRTWAKTSPGQARFSLQKADYFTENICNINRMLRALSPDGSPVVEISNENIMAYLHSGNPKFSLLRDSILPIPEVYHLASSFRALEDQDPGTGPVGFLERCTMGPLRQQPGQRFLDKEDNEMDNEVDTHHQSREETKSDGRMGMMKLNEYEKRISSGQINRENLCTTFEDVHAPQETISALKLLTSLALVRPDAFAYGVLAQDRIPGCLLYGPPGTGKTMLAKAVAKESGANMLEISGATINDKWVGESEKLIRAVFTLAKKLEPCVVFIDEADSLLANRSMFSNRASHREHINQFLKEWDGMEETNAFIMVATNRPFDLDDAVLRRLPRKILMDLPLKADRAAILRLLLRDESLDSSVSLDDLAQKTAYYSGSDLKNVCVAAAMAAVEEENEAAAKHEGPEPYQYSERRVLRHVHFENAVKQIPASISEDMTSLKLIRRFDDEYGNGRRQKKKASMGFGVLDNKGYANGGEARIRSPISVE